MSGGEPEWGVTWMAAMGSPALAEKTLETTNWSGKMRGERRLANAFRPSAWPGRGSHGPRHGWWPWTSPEFTGNGPTSHQSTRRKVLVNEGKFASSPRRRTEAEKARISGTMPGELQRSGGVVRGAFLYALESKSDEGANWERGGGGVAALAFAVQKRARCVGERGRGERGSAPVAASSARETEGAVGGRRS